MIYKLRYCVSDILLFLHGKSVYTKRPPGDKFNHPLCPIILMLVESERFRHFRRYKQFCRGR